ncbi:hypothetical protein JFL43_16680 [Viridibacillus sp. YIM B01967]|uniref:Peptidase S26 domain-containing protein n=1 Tax=Viridibacillus soli TaxID=2798301 RepID=A0ABS1HAK8_9BACL|nr:S26 family signal peptidase [Viridibacillus soli]MBK3496464.1 hypothetical protein [Viridibacillus soli]
MDHLSRIIGLPGETVEIKDGKVFISRQKLDTFYGLPQVQGANTEEELKKLYHSEDTSEDLQNAKEKLHYSLKSFTLKENEVFVLPDNREYADKIILKLNDIHAIVLGYEDAKVQFTLTKKEKKLQSIQDRFESETFKGFTTTKYCEDVPLGYD